ncbi:MAG: hypothetical protein ABI898_03270 [Sphingomonadales bacterium]
MTGSTTIQLTIPAELLGELDKLAASFGADRNHVILTALHRFVADEDEGGRLELNDGLDALLKEAIDDLDNGRWVSHEEVVRQFNERVRRAA